MPDKNLFKKAACFSDIHFGLKSNSVTHNTDCKKFIEWFIAQAKENDCETCIFLGDFHHNRANINVLTLNYMLDALERLNSEFQKVYFIVGNHDLYYKDRRDVQSAIWAKHLGNIVIIEDWFTAGNVSIIPWLIGEDHKKIKKIKSKYVFGHFELPGYFMNAMIRMPDHGEIHPDHFDPKIEHIFSGHFHKRQTSKNVTYIGNAFPHNYSDAGDDERGMMILEWDGEPRYLNWPDCPKYRVMNLSDILDHADDILSENMHLRVIIDIPISYEEATFIKETFIDQYKLREITLIPQKDDNEYDTDTEISYESVDQIVTSEILNIESDTYEKQTLLMIYEDL